MLIHLNLTKKSPSFSLSEKQVRAPLVLHIYLELIGNEVMVLVLHFGVANVEQTIYPDYKKLTTASHLFKFFKKSVPVLNITNTIRQDK